MKLHLQEISKNTSRLWYNGKGHATGGGTLYVVEKNVFNSFVNAGMMTIL